jgi:hypothetical protein
LEKTHGDAPLRDSGPGMTKNFNFFIFRNTSEVTTESAVQDVKTRAVSFGWWQMKEHSSLFHRNRAYHNTRGCEEQGSLLDNTPLFSRIFRNSFSTVWSIKGQMKHEDIGAVFGNSQGSFAILSRMA